MVDPSATFKIMLEYVTNAQNVSKSVQQLTQAQDRLTRSFQNTTKASSILSTIIGVSVGAYLARGVWDKAIRQNMEFEKSIFSIGAILNATLGDPQSEKSLLGWIRVGGVLTKDFEKMAAVSAATLSDYILMAKTIASPIARVTHSVDALKDFTDLAIGASTALGVSYEHAATGIQLALAGAARSQNEMIRLLGIEATVFNRYSPAMRYKKLSEMLQKYALVNKKFEGTFVGTWNTFTDIMGISIRQGVDPFFKIFTKGLYGLNQVLKPMIGTMGKLLTISIAFSAIKLRKAVASIALNELTGLSGIFSGLAAGGRGGISGGIGRLLGITPKRARYVKGIGNVGSMALANLIGMGGGREGKMMRAEVLRSMSGKYRFVNNSPSQIMSRYLRGRGGMAGAVGAPLLRGGMAAGGLLAGGIRGLGTAGGAAGAAFALPAIGGLLKAILDFASKSGALSAGEGVLTVITSVLKVMWTVLKGVGDVIYNLVYYGIGQMLRLLPGVSGFFDNFSKYLKEWVETIQMFGAWWTSLFKTIKMFFVQGGFAAMMPDFMGGSKEGREAQYKLFSGPGSYFMAEYGKALADIEAEKAGTPKTQLNIGEVRIIQNFKEHVNPDNVALSITEHLKQIANNPVSVR